MKFTARYDLRHRTASFDFFTWAAYVKLLGATEIVFGLDLPKQRRWTATEIRTRFNSIVQPAPPLFGLPSREAKEADEGQELGSHRIHLLAKIAEGRDDSWRMNSILPPRSERFTVTLRRSSQKSWRNSDEEVWREFARRIGAYVIEDYEVKPISLHERFALYAGAQMNFGVVNGPLAVLFYSHYPVMMCGCIIDRDHMRGHGMEAGTQHLLALPGQSLVWEPPTIEGLMSRFREAGLSA